MCYDTFFTLLINRKNVSIESVKEWLRAFFFFLFLKRMVLIQSKSHEPFLPTIYICTYVSVGRNTVSYLKRTILVCTNLLVDRLITPAIRRVSCALFKYLNKRWKKSTSLTTDDMKRYLEPIDIKTII